MRKSGALGRAWEREADVLVTFVWLEDRSMVLYLLVSKQKIKIKKYRTILDPPNWKTVRTASPEFGDGHAAPTLVCMGTRALIPTVE